MTNGKQWIRRISGMLLALAVLFSGVFGGTWTATVFRASASGGLIFTVPETIYLQPTTGGSTQMQYFLNVNPNGTVPQGYSGQGSVYFSYPAASQVQVTCSDPYVTLSQNGGTNTVNATIGGHLQSAVPSGSTRELVWTATYTENGQTKTIQTYSVAYAPAENPVGAIAAANAYKSGTNVYASCSTLIYGVQNVSASATSSLNLNGTIQGSSTLDGTGKYMYPLPGHTNTPQMYAGAQPPTTANLLRSSDSGVQMTSTSGTAYGYASTGHTSDVLVSGGTGRICYDASRVTQIGQIPNFYIHSFLNGAGSDDSFSRADDFSEKAYFFLSDSPVAATNASYACSQYWSDSYETQSVVRVPDPSVGCVSLTGGYKTLYSVVTRSWEVSVPLSGRDHAQATAAAACEFYGVDKSSVRALYLQELSQARQCGSSTQAWSTYQSAMHSAAAYLGTPMATGFSLSTLTSAAQALENSSRFTLTIQPNGGAFASGSTAAQTVTQTAGSTYTLPTNLTRNGYTFAGWKKADGSTVGNTYTFGTQSETLYAQWTINRFTLTLQPNGGAFASGSTAAQTVTQSFGSTYTLPTDLTKNGYTFAGWKKADGSTVGSTYTFGTQNETLTAHWTVNDFTLTLVSNGGAFSDGTTANKIVTQSFGSTYTLPTDLTQDGYTFAGWAKADGSTVSGTYTFGTQNETLTAHWTVNDFTLTLVSNGGAFADGTTANKTVTQPFGSTYTLPTDLTRDGYMFAGWKNAYGCTVDSDYTFGTENETLTAKWTAEILTLTLDPNGGAFSDGSTGVRTVTQAPGSTYMAPTDLTRDGYWFVGWEKENTVVFKGTPYTFEDSDETLTAHWIEDTYQRFEFGSYPQTLVTDPDVIAALQSTPQTWVSYHYYIGTGNFPDGQMAASDYMQYCDVICGGQKYRGVQFTQYRPRFTSYSSSEDTTFQDDNGYVPNTVYWFRWEPLQWRVLDPDTGLVLCEWLIDGQAYNNFLQYDSASNKFYGNAAHTYLANDYAHSDIRAWLTDAANETSFLNTAFTAAQRDAIYSTVLNNNAYSTTYSAYNSASTTDKIFLLSWSEAMNPGYGFPSDTDCCDVRLAQGTDYAKCQGIDVYQTGYTHWQLRSPGHVAYTSCLVSIAGSMGDHCNTDGVFIGVRPAMRMDPAYITALVQGTTGTSTLMLDPNGGAFPNGSTAAQTITQTTGSTYALPMNLMRTGYAFGGWQRQDGSMTGSTYTFGTQNETLTAKWNLIPCTLTLDPDGGTFPNGSTAIMTLTQPCGSAYTLPTNMTRTGYTFGGWQQQDGSTVRNSYTFGTQNETLTAKWTANTYTVMYNGNGATNGGTASSTHTFSVPQALTANGFARAFTVTFDHNYAGIPDTTDTAAASFNGWNTAADGSGTAYADGAAVTSLTADPGRTVMLYAQWTDGSVTLPTLSRSGYTFGGWYADTAYTVFAGAGGAEYTPAADCTLRAKWSRETRTLTFYPNGGAFEAANGFMAATSPLTKQILFGDLFGTADAAGRTWPQITLDGYALAGWNTEQDGSGAMVSAADTVETAVAMRLYAIWTPASADLTLDPNGGAFPNGSTAAQIIMQPAGSTYTLPTDLSRNGYTFIGWRQQNGSLIPSNVYTFGAQNETLTAQWALIVYTLTLDPNGGVWQDGSADVDTETGCIGDALVVAPPTRAGFTFLGWAFNLDFSGTFNGTTDTYVFGWTNDTMTAQWDAILYTLTLAVNGGVWANGNPTDMTFRQTAGSIVPMPTGADLTRPGYTFAGWQRQDGSMADSTYLFGMQDETLTAQWTAVSYTMKFDPNGGAFAGDGGFVPGTQAQTKQIAFGSTYGAADAQCITWPGVTKNGYTCIGWNTAADGTGVMIAPTDTVTATGSVYVYAMWMPVPLTLTINPNGGAFADGSSANQTVTNIIGFMLTLPTGLTRNGYTFSGWVLSGGATGSVDNSTGAYVFGWTNDTVTAQWTPVVYTLTLDPDGGVWQDGSAGVDTATGCIGDALVIAPPTKAGYAFVGWQLSSGATGSVDNSTGTYVYGWSNDTLTAQWTNVGTLSLSLPGGNGGGRPLTPGTLFPVTLTISDNPGLISLFVEIHYDPVMLELDHVDNPELFGPEDPNDPLCNPSPDLTLQPYPVSWIDVNATQNFTQNGDLLVYWFRVRNTAHVDRTTVSLSYWQASTFDANLNDVLFNTGSLQLPICAMVGDVNYNCVFNMADAVQLARHLHDPANYPIAAINSDVNGDGVINRADVRAIMRSIAGNGAIQLPYYVHP